MMADGPARELRKAYGREVRSRSRQAARVACWLGIALVPCFGLLDLVLFPDRVPVFVALRAACVGAIGAILWLLARPIGGRRPELLALVVACVIVLMIDVMIAQTGGIESRYWAGLSLVLLALTVLMPWEPAWPIVATVLIVGSYVVTISLAGPRPPVVDLVNNLAFLVSSGVIATVGSLRAGRLQWLEFSQRAALEDALRHKSDFMAKMSHELRTPLHAIIGYTDMLRDDDAVPAGARDFLERIRSRSHFLYRMISDLLDFAKVEAGKMRLRRDTVDVAAIVDQAVTTVRPLAARKGLTVVVAAAGDLPPIASDAHRVEQIVLNLLANAIKFTERGGVTVDIEVVRGRPAVFIPLDAARPWPDAEAAIAVLVRDTGIGIVEHDLRQLANDFHQAEGAAEDYGGTGLGLSISRRLAGLLGGGLFVQSRPGVGSTFAVVLPVAAGEAASAPASRRAA